MKYSVFVALFCVTLSMDRSTTALVERMNKDALQQLQNQKNQVDNRLNALTALIMAEMMEHASSSKLSSYKSERENLEKTLKEIDAKIEKLNSPVQPKKEKKQKKPTVAEVQQRGQAVLAESGLHKDDNGIYHEGEAHSAPTENEKKTSRCIIQ